MNVHADDPASEAPTSESFRLDDGVVERQIERTAVRVAARDPRAHADAIAALDAVAREGGNVMPTLVSGARAGATIGEMADVFREVFGEFREPNPW